MEAYLLDTFLHLLLGLCLMALVQWVWHQQVNFEDERSVSKSGQIAAVVLYFREVTQHQTKYYQSDIFSGWLPWVAEYPWSFEKQVETFVPILFLLLVHRLLRMKHLVRPRQ